MAKRIYKAPRSNAAATATAAASQVAAATAAEATDEVTIETALSVAGASIETAAADPANLPSGEGEVPAADPASIEGEPVPAGEETPVSDAPQATEAAEATGKEKANILSAIDPVAGAAQMLDKETIEAIKTQILGIPAVERRQFLAFKSVRHDNVRTPAGGWLTVTRAAHASLAARNLVSEDWDDGLPEEG